MTKGTKIAVGKFAILTKKARTKKVRAIGKKACKVA